MTEETEIRYEVIPRASDMRGQETSSGRRLIMINLCHTIEDTFSISMIVFVMQKFRAVHESDLFSIC
jgi:hypothetical protein